MPPRPDRPDGEDLVVTDAWKRASWVTLHSLSFAYPQNPTPQQKRDMFELLRAFGRLLPCEVCRTHYAAYMERHRLFSPASTALQSRATLSAFLVDFHNSVNRRLGKRVVDYETAKRMHTTTDAPSADEAPGWMIGGACMVAAVLLLWLVRKNVWRRT